MVRQVLAKSIKLADQVNKASDRAIVNSTTKESIPEIKSKTQKLASVLRQLNSSDLSNSFLGSYNAPQRQILKDIEQNLDRSLSFLLKIKRFRVNFIVLTKIKCCFTTIPSGLLPRISLLLECSIRDMLWLLRVIGNREDVYSEIPPIASNEPILLLIWEQIGILSHEDDPLQFRLDAAFTLIGFARDNDRYATLIIQEGGIEPLLKFIQEGPMEGQENAARTLGLLARGEGVEHMIHEGVGKVFAEILKEGHMKVQAVVAWAVSMLADERPKFQDYFAQNDVVPLLVSHLIIKSNSNNFNLIEEIEIKAEMNYK